MTTLEHTASDRDIVRVVSKSTIAAVAIGALAFGLWQVRSVIILLFLALTFAAAIRPGVEWLRAHRVPQPAAIGAFFAAVGGTVVLFFWAAVPPALHQVQHALRSHDTKSAGFRHTVLTYVDKYLHKAPSGGDVLHPIATYGHQATSGIVATFFTLAATWYWVSERDTMINLLTQLAPAARREKTRQTLLAIDDRLGAYTRLKFMMIFAIGAVLSLGFYLVGLHYWLLAGGFVSLVEIVPVIGPVIGAIFVVAIALPQSLHVAALSLLVVVAVREFQSYVINPHLMGRSVGLSPLVTLISVAVVSVLFGGFAVILAVPFMSAVATVIDVLVLDHDVPAKPPRRSSFTQRFRGPADAPAPPGLGT